MIPPDPTPSGDPQASPTPASPATAAPGDSPPVTPPASPSPPDPGGTGDPAGHSQSPPIGPDGSLSENWFLALGDEFAPHAKDLGKHKNLRSLITELDYFRKNGVEYPGEGSSPQAVDRFRKIANVPDDPAGYGLNPETLKLPDGMEFDQELADAVSRAAHAAHAPPAAVQAIATAFNDQLARQAQAAQAAAAKARQEAQDALVAEWRGDFQANASTVRHITSRLAEAAGIDGGDPAIQQLANEPAFARIMMQVSKLTAEDRIQTPTGFGDLRSAAQKISDIKRGQDPVWSPLYASRSEADRLKAYEHIKSLRDQAER